MSFNFQLAASAVLKECLKKSPEEIVFADITALELVTLMLIHITTCPACGSEAFVNIDCSVCTTCSNVQKAIEA